MKKIGNIMLLVAGIYTIVGAISCLASAIICFVFSSPLLTPEIIKAIEAGQIHSSFPGTPAEIAAQIQIMLLVGGIVCAVEILFSAACAFIAFFGRIKQTEGLYIANIVLGVVNGSPFSIAGGVLGVIATAKEKKQQ